MKTKNTFRVCGTLRWTVLGFSGWAFAAPPPPPPPPPPPTASFPQDIRSMDGAGNNRQHSDWGQADHPLVRWSATRYADGTGTPVESGIPGAREVSNAVAAQSESRLNAQGATDMVWQWGQFLDHDIDLSATVDPVESFDVPVPTGDPYFDPYGTGTQVIPLERSYYEIIRGVREQVNEITAFIDGSNVYGSDDARAQALRTLDGTGKLKTSDGDLLPWNTDGLDNAGGTSASLFVAGDVRANEQAGLTAMHTLFVREHNHWAGFWKNVVPGADDETLYQLARGVVVAELQQITYTEFLPVLLGENALGNYPGYDPQKNPSIANEFSTAAYRLGHSMLSSTMLRLGADGQPIAEGNISLAQAFFNPANITSVGIDPYLRGLAGQQAQEIDNQIVDDVRNFLFGPPGSGGLDLASLNIQRGRDHGLATYNQARRDLGLPPALGFADVSSDPSTRDALASVYGSVEDIDLWVGELAEDKVPGAMVGPLLQRILVRQFRNLRDGDRFWYEAYLPPDVLGLVRDQNLARIIRRNTGVGQELQEDVFRMPRNEPPPPPPRRRR